LSEKDELCQGKAIRLPWAPLALNRKINSGARWRRAILTQLPAPSLIKEMLNAKSKPNIKDRPSLLSLSLISTILNRKWQLMDDFISLERIVKVYPPNVLAVNNVSVGIRKGEIHAIIGENGAGKSTLMKILYGLIPFDSGTVRLAGNPVHFKKPADAIAMGIGMVHQEIELISQYEVWENVVLGAEPIQGAIGKLNVKQAIELVRAKIDEFQFNLDPEAIVDRISVAARQKVEILKLLYRNVSVLILDEPTSVLTPQEIPQLFAELKRLRDKGTTILFISHRLDEVLELSDRITVMRKGQKIATVVAAETNKAELAQMMVGRQVIFTSKRTTHKAGECVFETKNLNLVRRDGFKLLDDISFSVHAGEIVGIAGVEGNGQFELVNCIMGLAEPSSGHIEVGNKEITRAKQRAYRSQQQGDHPTPHPRTAQIDFICASRSSQDGREHFCVDIGKCHYDAPSTQSGFFEMEGSCAQLPNRAGFCGISCRAIFCADGIISEPISIAIGGKSAKGDPWPRIIAAHSFLLDGSANARARCRVDRVCA